MNNWRMAISLGLKKKKANKNKTLRKKINKKGRNGKKQNFPVEFSQLL